MAVTVVSRPQRTQRSWRAGDGERTKGVKHIVQERSRRVHPEGVSLVHKVCMGY